MAAKKPAKDQPKPENRLSRGRTREDARFTAALSLAGLPESYAATLQEIKTHLRSARVRAVLAANPIVLEAYWHTGKIIRRLNPAISPRTLVTLRDTLLMKLRNRELQIQN